MAGIGSSIIAGGTGNTISSTYSFIGGGTGNTVDGIWTSSTFSNIYSNSSVVGGGSNTIRIGGYSNIGGGQCNLIFQTGYSNIGGGYCNSTCSRYSTIGGGSGNKIGYYSDYSTIVGGTCNIVPSDASYLPTGTTIVGGCCNSANGTNSFIGAGACNLISTAVNYSFIGGGYGNCINGSNGNYGTISGGYRNKITCPSPTSTIAGGAYNTVCNNLGTVSGGYGNVSSGYMSTVIGGRNNCVSGAFSAVGGGQNLNNTCDCSFLAYCLINGSLIGSTTRSISVNAGGTIVLTSSDCRLKTDIKDINIGLNEISSLRPVMFNWCDKLKCDLGYEQQYGFIAQEICNVLPTTVNEDNNGFLSIDLVKLVPVLTKSIQELKSCNDSLQNQITELSLILKKNNIN